MLLTHPHKEWTLGNFMGDMIKSDEIAQLAPAIRQGVLIHRRIDHFTDNHATVREATAIFRESQRKYASVVIDMVFDHILACRWSDYCTVEYSTFCELVYSNIGAKIEHVPDRLLPHVERMLYYRFLHGYNDRANFHRALQRLDERASFPSNFHSALEVYEKSKPEIDGLFMVFFPEIVQFIKEKKTY
jgi:acyl carrier protein phosphodiesterase